eukprot:3934132-Rhodomonas_salina.4
MAGLTLDMTNAPRKWMSEIPGRTTTYRYPLSPEVSAQPCLFPFTIWAPAAHDSFNNTLKALAFEPGVEEGPCGGRGKGVTEGPARAQRLLLEVGRHLFALVLLTPTTRWTAEGLALGQDIRHEIRGGRAVQVRTWSLMSGSCFRNTSTLSAIFPLSIRVLIISVTCSMWMIGTKSGLSVTYCTPPHPPESALSSISMRPARLQSLYWRDLHTVGTAM